jgi:hypothetical protein
MPISVTWQGASPNQLLETCKTLGIVSKNKSVSKAALKELLNVVLFVIQDWILVHEIKATLDAAPPSDWIQTTNHVGETYWFNKSSGQTSTASPVSKQLQSIVDRHRKLAGQFRSQNLMRVQNMMVPWHRCSHHVRRSLDPFQRRER